ncbi:glycosyltransferase [Nostoc sp. CMAA1605]|uniref:glycosyltransferase n=1 Tax=Nostoc sp. CMAA1605 TaxID=2055159 RepID=UPI001F18832E|nr:glycosyltransferase [Nostoc sp. CMAA1605]MCF4970310.1 glycosyl transferase family A [Nostoc sp. CMAA1605]
MKPTISVIIPVYNGEKTIQETIQSVLNQTFSSIEIIVINDGSTDATLNIIESIDDPRLRVFSYPNAGLAASRNRGLSHRVGQFVSFLDADDLWTADKLYSQLQLLEENPDAAVVYSWTDYIDSDGRFLKAGRHTTVMGDVYQHLLIWNFLENGSNPLIRYDAIRMVGNFDETLKAAEDWDMWLRLAACYKFSVVPKTQILYRLSSNSMSSNIIAQEIESLKVIERAFSSQKALSLQDLKNKTFAYLYKYLTFKSLEKPMNLHKRWTSFKFLCKYIKYNPSAILQKLILITLFKIFFT